MDDRGSAARRTDDADGRDAADFDRRRKGGDRRPYADRPGGWPSVCHQHDRRRGRKRRDCPRHCPAVRAARQRAMCGCAQPDGRFPCVGDETVVVSPAIRPWFGLLLAAASGAVALSYELLWYRAFSIALMARPQAFGVVL